ncbi:hypothetical protein ABEB36_003955 [Hypothenemus hampei]|uniref:Peroxisomal membrane protein PEX16 n=1 Tax=Hypothenemus hampei TaxID=57062 RepID=A0ABD1F224_HYPHA
MSSVLLSIPELYNSYKQWVIKNPQITSDYETTAKWISYFIAGRINNSHTLSELVYCLSNLLILFNDNIIRQSLYLKVKNSVEKIKLWLAIVEYSEVFCELSAQKLWGNTGKWIIIITIQAFKCLARILLIYKHKESIIDNPTISPLDREKAVKEKDKSGLHNGSEMDSVSFTLKRSGRVVRKIESSPPLALRTWKPLVSHSLTPINENTYTDITRTRIQFVAESIYIAKPLIHLLSMRVFGSKAWKPWMISLALDLTSLQLYKSIHKRAKSSLTRNQKLQLSKRTVLLLLYLIRSPFYEEHSENKINAFLMVLSKNLPLAKLICVPLMQYLPFWQSNYFYMWST